MKHLMKKSEIKGTLEVFNVRLDTEEEENPWTWLCEVKWSCTFWNIPKWSTERIKTENKVSSDSMTSEKVPSSPRRTENRWIEKNQR